jgi:hypothetical protein
VALPVLWAAAGLLLGWTARGRSDHRRDASRPTTLAAPVDRAPGAAPECRRVAGERCAGSSTVAERRVVVAQPVAIVALAAAMVLPQPVRAWAAVTIAVLWALAGLAFAAALAARLVARVRALWARRRLCAWFRVRRSALAAYGRSVPGVLARAPAVWPFLILSGPATAAFALELLPADVTVGVFLGSVAAGLPVQVIVGGREMVSELNAHVSLAALAVSVALWIAAAAVVAYEFGWPAPAEAGYFAAAAQINSTLLIAGVINAAPAAWRITPRIHLTWILTAPTVAVIGVGASIAGAISTRGSDALFVLSISPLAPIVVAVMLGAYEQVTWRRDAASGSTDIPGASQSGSGPSGGGL